MLRRHLRAVLAALALAALLGRPAAAAGDPPAGQPLSEVEVVATGLFPGIGVDARLIPAHVQHIDAQAISRQHEHDMGEVLNSAATSVSVNDTEGNPFQRDVTFRGFTASPVLGTPQGMSVYVDGVRVNEAFGDTVGWDLISPASIAQIDIVPGSNPVYGLNTLAGAIAIQTKRGTANTGSGGECTTGSFHRVACTVQTGGLAGPFDYFAAADSYRDNGWGQENPSQLKHYYARVGLRQGRADWSLSAAISDDDLYGNQTIPLSFMSDPAQAYTYPDQNTNRLTFLNLMGHAPLGERWLVAGSVHWRHLNSFVVNSNVNGSYDPALGLVAGNAPTNNATNHATQSRPGASVQFVNTTTILGRENTFTLGMEWERGSTDFLQYNQDAGFSRNTTSDAPLVLQTNLHALNELAGVYFNDTYAVTSRLALSASARYSRAHTRLGDNLGTANDGNDTYSRLLPAAGIAYQVGPDLRAYASFSEGMRVPSPVELTCADPNAPCQLPNAFSADPPLRAVQAQTYELGFDGRIAQQWSWNAGAFRTTLFDDIQFIGAGAGSVNSGYFQNVGSTRRQGLELGLSGHVERWSVSLHYSYTDAEFRSNLQLFSPDNTSATFGSVAMACAVGSCGTIAVAPGDRLPGVPRHNAKARAEYAFTTNLRAGIEALGQSSQYARGDENNRDARGAVPGFVVMNLDGNCAVTGRLSVYVRVANVFNRRYSTFGMLGTNYFNGPHETYSPAPVYVTGGSTGSGNAGGPTPVSGGTVADATGSAQPTQFRSIGPPRGAWLGVTYSFGGTPAR